MAQLSLPDELMEKLTTHAAQENLSVVELLSHWADTQTTSLPTKPSDALTYYKTIFNNARDSILIIGDNDRYIDANPAACEMLGYSLDEIRQLSFWDVITPEFAANLENMRPQFHEDGSLRGECPFVHKDGRVVETEFFSVQTPLNGIQLAIVRDITERKQAEIRLAAQRNFFREIIDRVDNLIYVKSVDGHNILVNQALAELYSTTPDKRTGKNDSDYITDLERLNRARLSDRKIIATGEPEIIPIQKIQIKGGKPHWYRIQKTPIPAEDGSGMLILVVATDITERIQAEARLKAQRNFFREIIDRSDSLIYVKRVDGYNVLVNKAMAELYGLTTEERIGTYDSDYIKDPERLKMIQASDRHIIETGEPEIIPAQQIIVGKAGLRWYRIHKTPIPSEDGKEMLILAVATDVSDQKKAEARLQTQRNFLREVIDRTDNIIFIKGVDSRYVLVNKTVANLFNTTPEQHIGKSDADYIFDLERLRKIQAADREIIETGQSELIPAQKLEIGNTGVRWYRTHKSPIPSEDGTETWLLVVGTDITEQKDAEEALREREQFLSTIYDHAQMNIFIVDVTEDGDFVIAGMNRAHETALPVRITDIVGKRLDAIDVFASDVIETLRANYQRCLNAGRAITYEEDVPINDVDTRWLTTLTPLFDSQEQVYRIIGFSINVTESKRAEQTAQHLQLLELQLEQTRHLQDFKSRVLAMIAHEFRTPIAVMQTSTHLLKRQVEKQIGDDNHFERYFERLAAQVKRLTTMVDDVVQINDYNLETPRPTLDRIDFENFLQHIVEEARLSSTRNALIPVVMSGDYVRYHRVSDEEFLRRIVTNLVSNAIKYSAEDDTILVTCDCDIDAVTIQVQDSGMGISTEDQAHIFDIFYRSEKVSNLPGTGLGLAIVQQCVEALDGKITFTSAEGQGTTFTVALPMPIASGEPN